MYLYQLYRNTLCNWCTNRLDPLYNVVKGLETKTQEQTTYLNYYENSFTLHLTSLVSLLPSFVWYFKWRREQKMLFGTSNRSTIIKMLVYSSVSFNLFMGSLAYDRIYHPQGLDARLRQKHQKQINLWELEQQKAD